MAGLVTMLVAALLGIVTLIGSSLVPTLWSAVRITHDTEARNILDLAARSLSSESVLTGAAYTPPTPGALPGDTKQPTNAAATGAGVIPASSGAPKTDPWGHYILYCTWPQTGDYQTIKLNVAHALIMAGSNGKADTTCAQAAAGTTNGDDKIRVLTVANALPWASPFQIVDTNGRIQFGASFPGQVRVGIGTNDPQYPSDVVGDSRVSGNLIVGGAASAASLSLTTPLPIASGGSGANTAANARFNFGLGSIATQDATAINIDGGTIDGTTIGATTTATGAFTTLAASGATSLTSTLAVTGLGTFSAGLTLSSGVFTAPAGTVAAPSLTFSGSTTTGVYLPAAGSLALSASGTSRLWADSTGFLSLGAAPGGEDLRVTHAAGSSRWITATGSAASNPAINTSAGNLVINSFSGLTSIGGATNAESLAVQNTAGAVNHVTVTGVTTGNGPTIAFTGTDANVAGILNTQGTGNLVFETGGAIQAAVTATAAATRYITLTGSTGAGNPNISTSGGGLALTPASGVLIGAPTGGALGAGTLNATDLRVNNVPAWTNTNFPVSSTAGSATNQVLGWNGSAWAPTTLTGGTGGSGAISVIDARIGAITSNGWCAANAGGTLFNCNLAAPNSISGLTATRVPVATSATSLGDSFLVISGTELQVVSGGSGGILTDYVTYTSDKNLKDVIGPMADPLARLKQLNPVRYFWNNIYKAAGRGDNDEHEGLLAQDVRWIMPEAVRSSSPQGYLAVDYARLVPLLVGAVKELSDRVDDVAKGTAVTTTPPHIPDPVPAIPMSLLPTIIIAAAAIGGLTGGASVWLMIRLGAARRRP